MCYTVKCSTQKRTGRIQLLVLYILLLLLLLFFFRNLFTHGALRSSLELVETCPSVPDRIQVLQKTLGWTDYQIFLTYGASLKTNRHKKSNAYRIPPEGL